MLRPIDERDNFDFEGAMLVASSRSGVTQNVELANGKLVEIIKLASGRVDCFEVEEIDSALTLRGREPYTG